MAGFYYRFNELSDSVKCRKLLESVIIVLAYQGGLSSMYLFNFPAWMFVMMATTCFKKECGF